jgi:single-strand DNA-binding protein
MTSKARNSSTTSKTENTRTEKSSQGTSVNRVILAGRLVAAPVLRTTSSGKHVTTVRVATNDRAQAEFHHVVLWGQLAEFTSQYLGKGRSVYVEGRLQSRTWQAADGSTRRTVEIVASTLKALGRDATAETAA